jgi:hypothetical protein
MPPSAVVTIFTAWKLNTLDVGPGAAHRLALVAGAGGVRRVLQHPEAVAVGQLARSRHVAGQAGEVHRNDHLRQRPAGGALQLVRQRRHAQVARERGRCRRSRHPHRSTRALAEARKLLGWSTRMSPGPRPSARQARCRRRGVAHRHRVRHADAVGECGFEPPAPRGPASGSPSAAPPGHRAMSSSSMSGSCRGSWGGAQWCAAGCRRGSLIRRAAAAPLRKSALLPLS